MVSVYFNLIKSLVIIDNYIFKSHFISYHTRSSMSIEYILIWMVLMFIIKRAHMRLVCKKVIPDFLQHFNETWTYKIYQISLNTHILVVFRSIHFFWDRDLRLVSRNPGIMSVTEMWHFVQPSVTRYYQPRDNVTGCVMRCRQHAHTW